VNTAGQTFGVVLPALLVAHAVGDFLVQTNRQATRKSLPGWLGRWACLGHVASYTLTSVVVVGCLWGAFDLDISPLGFVVGQLVSAVTHYFADRRKPLERLARLVGNGAFWDLGAPRNGVAWTEDQRDVGLYVPGRDGPEPWDQETMGQGKYLIDQAWHLGWLLVAAYVMAVM
jgi:hypothetical protein